MSVCVCVASGSGGSWLVYGDSCLTQSLLPPVAHDAPAPVPGPPTHPSTYPWLGWYVLYNYIAAI